MNLHALQEATDVKITGELVFFSIENGDIAIPHQHVIQLWNKHDLNEDLFELTELRPPDVFRRVTSQMEGVLESEEEKDQKTRWIVREVVSDPVKIIRHLVEEIVDTSDERLAYRELGRWILDRTSETMTGSRFVPGCEEALQQAVQDYQNALGVDNRKTLMNLNNRAFNHLNPVSIAPKSSGRFVLQSYSDHLDRLGHFWEGVHAAGGGRIGLHFDRLPLFSSEELEHLIRRRATKAFSKAIGGISKDLRDLLSDDAVNLRRVQGQAKKLHAIKTRIKEYNQALGTRLQLVERQLMTALSQTEVAMREAV